MTNLEISELLRAIAASYKIKDEEKYKYQIIAYERAADAIEHSSSEVKDLWDEGKLEDIAGVGKNISQHLSEIFSKGRSKHFEEIMKDLPKQMFDLMLIPGIGAKSAYKLVKNLNIKERDPIKQLEIFAKKGLISKIEGFGKDSEKDILNSINKVKGVTKRYLLPYAENIANDIILWIRKEKSVKKVDALGSLRRKVSTVGDIDIAVASDNSKAVIEHFIKYPKVKRVIDKGSKSASILIFPNIRIDLKVQSFKSYGSLLQHFTGSKHHNIALREYSLKMGYSLSEYGIRDKRSRKLLHFASEEDFYGKLGLQWIPPELRENSGEIEFSKNNKLPLLVNIKDIKSDFHIHSNFNTETSHDLGLSTIEEIIKKSCDLKYEYFVLAEHNPSHSKHSKKEIIDLLKKKKEFIDKINYSLVKNMKNRIKYIFNSLEVDILANGKIAIPEESLNYIDFALVSIHSSFRMNRSNMTKRVLNALSYEKVKIFAHPTARKINEREGIELEWDKIFDFCKKYDKWLEINADPMRLDLPDFLVREAIKKSIKLTLGTDAHHVDHMDNMKYAVYVARRGWTRKEDIINTRNYNEFKLLLKI